MTGLGILRGAAMVALAMTSAGVAATGCGSSNGGGAGGSSGTSTVDASFGGSIASGGTGTSGHPGTAGASGNGGSSSSAGGLSLRLDGGTGATADGASPGDPSVYCMGPGIGGPTPPPCAGPGEAPSVSRACCFHLHNESGVCTCTSASQACTASDCHDCCSGVHAGGKCLAQCTSSGSLCAGGDCSDCRSALSKDGTCVACLTNADCHCPSACQSNTCACTANGGRCAYGDCSDCCSQASSAGTCVPAPLPEAGPPPQPCKTNADCSSPTPWCDPGRLVCVECLGYWHCGLSLGRDCQDDGACRDDAPMVRCASGGGLWDLMPCDALGASSFDCSTDCCSGSGITVSGTLRCGTCTSHADCGSAKGCFEGACYDLTTCAVDADCGAPPWKCSSGSCRQCASSADCSGGQRCDTAIFRCRECVTSTDCPAFASTCVGGVCF
jgi:hypothetical protein